MNTRGLLVVGVAALVVVVGIVRLATPTGGAATEIAGGERSPENVPDVDELPRGVGPDIDPDVVSRVEAAPIHVQPDTDAGNVDEDSHIGPVLDPEADSTVARDSVTRHIGEYLDPDAESVSRGDGTVSHIGERLDPLADD